MGQEHSRSTSITSKADLYLVPEYRFTVGV
jgi:hypothetical protein